MDNNAIFDKLNKAGIDAPTFLDKIKLLEIITNIIDYLREVSLQFLKEIREK